MTQRPIILLGAARSGTKLLRDLIATSVAVTAVPYDINYVWRVGNEGIPHDEFPVTEVTPSKSAFVRAQVDRLSEAPERGVRPIEKTVSNPLRLPYVAKVFPDADYVWLIRDGRDVAESAMRCWVEPPNSGALLRKLREMPWRQTYKYAVGHGIRLAKQRFNPDSVLASWGPRYAGIDDDVRDRTLAEVCALQWKRSVEAFARDSHVLPSLVSVRYEDLAAKPGDVLFGLAEALALPDPDTVARRAAAVVRPDRVGGARALSASDERLISSVLADTLSASENPTEDPR